MSDQPGLARRLATADAVVIGLGSMIGAGVFSAFAPAAAAAGGGLLVGLGIAAVAIIFAVRGDLAEGDTELAALLAVMVFFAPVQALDDTVAGIFAVFAKPRAIFFRRHILAPGLRLLVVALLVLADQEVIFLAVGYVAAGAFGLYFIIPLLQDNLSWI
jgi:hypothetical protein